MKIEDVGADIQDTRRRKKGATKHSHTYVMVSFQTREGIAVAATASEVIC